ncbi:hypothetical protein [Nocardia coubleae]|uniref:Uncharacterized protein n=1 Tax=Nocardia coubleae TaxID=356147 RepID=A0A846W0Q9_9NOCA|nr:hypothetical protein [Nocardia coubleae]NKX86366.1 hypothetical protein [Nocardia coubleae]
MTDLESAAAALADELAIDLPRLQPAGQVRFDPATLGAVVGLWLLKNVADGVAEAIKEGSKSGTESLAQRIGAAIRRRVRGDLPGAMDSGADDRALDNAVVAAESAWDDAHSARAITAVPTGDLIAEAVDNVTAALIESGLPPASAARVGAVLRTELRLLLDKG